MRVIAHLQARADAVYDETYHHKLRGRLWDALDGTAYGSLHDENRPKGFTYSNPFPPGDMREGDEKTLLVASPHEELLAHVAADLKLDRELNIGEMPFRVESVNGLATDVGEPGTSGTIETGTGVLVRIPPWRFEEYGIDTDHDEAEFWRPEHTMEPFRNQIESNLDKKHGLFCPEYQPGPSAVDGDLFEGADLIKTFSIPVTVTQGQRETWVLSKWRFDYTVRDDHHRRHLNLALDTGIGERNSLGFGFVNITEKEDRRSGQKERVDA
ncbi:CRISPR-associated endoribonuclease Cas6 [Halomicrobium mukohataei]|uniref:CRISPR-associated endoribonuclease Cas6 n=1 Tax=Halomicrobium mukohataei TaxID=57705 RepID=A0A847UHS6_9EURY|nr:CRISPR-associated endoribonuclease Cas6 [Halomicrobium mukohataei]NLV11150.1 CRISPR-associated endoribonuclease Cas6 [Halomicrobium mukohataei]